MQERGPSALDDIRFTVPLYTLREAARYVRVPVALLRKWTKGSAAPAVTSLPPTADHLTLPFVGLVEAAVLAALRTAGIHGRELDHLLQALRREFGAEHVLASRTLASGDLLSAGGQLSLTGRAGADAPRRRDFLRGESTLGSLLRDELERISYADDGWASRLVLRLEGRDLLEIRPAQARGKPVFIRGRAPLPAVVSRWRAGDRMKALADDFAIPIDDLEDALRDLALAA